MEKLALNLPTFNNIANTPGNKFSGGNAKIGNVLTEFSSLALFIGGAMVFIWLVWGAYEYIISEGNKEGLAKARARIRWALVGFVILILSFFISSYLQAVLKPQNIPVTGLTPPGVNIQPQK